MMTVLNRNDGLIMPLAEHPTQGQGRGQGMGPGTNELHTHFPVPGPVQCESAIISTIRFSFIFSVLSDGSIVTSM